jgi:hypothetical protein
MKTNSPLPAVARRVCFHRASAGGEYSFRSLTRRRQETVDNKKGKVMADLNDPLKDSYIGKVADGFPLKKWSDGTQWNGCGIGNRN